MLHRLLMAALGTLALPAAAQAVLPVEQTPYHVPVFSNDYVTVLNVFVPAQRTSGYHRHSLDSLGVLITARTNSPDGCMATTGIAPTPASPASLPSLDWASPGTTC